MGNCFPPKLVKYDIHFLYYHRLSGLNQLMFNISQFLWVRNADTAYDLINLESVSQPDWDFITSSPRLLAEFMSLWLWDLWDLAPSKPARKTDRHKHTERNVNKISTTLCSWTHNAYKPITFASIC